MDLAALLGEQLHFFFGNSKDQHLLVLVEDTVSAHIEHFNELLRSSQSQEVVDVIASLLIDKSYVCIIEKAFFPEISASDGLPDFFALSGASDEWASLSDQYLDFLSRHVGQARKSLLAKATSQLMTVRSASLRSTNRNICSVSGRPSLKRFHY